MAETGATKKNTYIFDPIRRKRILLTPEERVRQQLIHFLIEERGCPAGLISVEKGLSVNGLSKRCDILVHGPSGDPVMLIECKASSVRLAQQTFDQVARYNIALRVPWLVISNGGDTYCARIDFENQSYAFHPDIPLYAEL
jgi:hypothetical protein